MAVERQVDVNLKGTFNTLREAAKRLRDGGRIINFSSSVVGLLQPTYGVYAGTKAAVEAMTSILARNCAAGASPSTPSRRDRDGSVPERQAAGGHQPPRQASAA